MPGIDPVAHQAGAGPSRGLDQALQAEHADRDRHRDPALGQMRHRQAGHRGADQQVAEIGGQQDQELRRAQGVAQAPVLGGAIDAAGGGRGGDLGGHGAVGPGGDLRQPGAPADHRRAERAQRQGQGHLRQPIGPPAVREHPVKRPDHPRPGDAAQGREGEIDAERHAPLLEHRRQHMGAGNQRHHLEADAAKPRAEEIDPGAVRPRQTEEARRHHRGPRQQRHPNAEPPDQQRRQQGRGAAGGAQHREAEPALRPAQLQVADHVRQHDAQGTERRGVDQEADQAEDAQQAPGSPLDLRHRHRHPFRIGRRQNFRL